MLDNILKKLSKEFSIEITAKPSFYRDIAIIKIDGKYLKHFKRENIEEELRKVLIEIKS